MKPREIPGIGRLVRNLILLEIGLTLLFFSLDRLIDWEEAYSRTALAGVVEVSLMLTIVIVGAEVAGVVLVVARWLRRSGFTPPPLKLCDLKKQAEGQRLEFKQTLRWDTRQKKVNPDLEVAVLKTIAAMANSEGGYLVIGLSDTGQAMGIEADYQTLNKKNRDGFEVLLNRLITDSLGVKTRSFCQILFESDQDREVCVVRINQSNAPVYCKEKQTESFFIRTGNNTVALSISQALAYIAEHPGFKQK